MVVVPRGMKNACEKRTQLELEAPFPVGITPRKHCDIRNCDPVVQATDTIRRFKHGQNQFITGLLADSRSSTYSIFFGFQIAGRSQNAVTSSTEPRGLPYRIFEKMKTSDRLCEIVTHRVVKRKSSFLARSPNVKRNVNQQALECLYQHRDFNYCL